MLPNRATYHIFTKKSSPVFRATFVDLEHFLDLCPFSYLNYFNFLIYQQWILSGLISSPLGSNWNKIQSLVSTKLLGSCVTNAWIRLELAEVSQSHPKAPRNHPEPSQARQNWPKLAIGQGCRNRVDWWKLFCKVYFFTIFLTCYQHFHSVSC